MQEFDASQRSLPIPFHNLNFDIQCFSDQSKKNENPKYILIIFYFISLVYFYFSSIYRFFDKICFLRIEYFLTSAWYCAQKILTFNTLLFVIKEVFLKFSSYNFFIRF